MVGLILKLVVCPSVVYLSDMLFAQVDFANWYQIIVVGLVLAASAHVMELWILKPGTLWVSTAVDFVAAAAIAYLAGQVLPNARVSLVGALLTAGLLTITEYFQHAALNQSGEVVK